MNLDEILQGDLSPDIYCLVHNKIINLEQQCKKAKEVIDKVNEYIQKRFYFNEETGEYSLLHTIDKDNIKELLDILKGSDNNG